MNLDLRRTLAEIADYLNSNNSNPLRIAKLINRVSPCRWSFKFTFDNTNQTNVWIDCDSALSDGHALSLLNGLLEEVFLLMLSPYVKTKNTLL